MLSFKRIVSSLLAAALLWPLLSPAQAAARLNQSDPPQVLRARLRNGMRVIIIRDTLAPVVATMMNYEVGSNQAPAGFPGTAHAQEHMMFRGSKTLSADQYAEITAITGGDFDADTQNTITQYFYLMPSADLDIALRLEAARASGLEDSAEQWQSERRAIEQEVTQDNSMPDYRLYVQMQGHLLRGTPDAIDGLGTIPSFNKTTAAMLKKFYAAYYHPNNAIFIVAGNVNPAATLSKIQRLFGSIPPARIHETVNNSVPPPVSAVYRTESDLPYTAVLTGYLYPSYHSREWAAAQVLSDVLSSQRSSLYALVASGKALQVQFFPNFLPDHGTAFVEIDVPTGSSPDAALKNIEDAIDAYKAAGVPADLVEAAKNREIAQAEFQQNSIYGLANAWSTAVALEGRSGPQDDVDAIRNVTPGQVTAVLRKYLVNKTATVGYAIPKPGGPVSAGGAGKQGENNTVIPKGPVILPAWATHLLNHLRVPEKTLNPTVTKLPNGITLIVQPENQTHTVIVSGGILNNPQMETPHGEMGIDPVTSDLLPYGTTTYSRLDYQAELDRISATVTTGTTFGIDVLSRYFDRAVQLLADVELHPRFAPDDFKVVQQEELGQVQGEATGPDHLKDVALAQALYPAGDPKLRFSTPDSVSKLTLDEVKAYYAEVYRPDMTTIVVVGDVTPAQAEASVSRWFGGWTASGPKPAVDPAPAPDNKTAFRTVPDVGRIQDSVTLAQTLTLRRSDPDYIPLNVANAILGEGFYASLLYHDLREVNGYVYYVGSSLDADKTRSAFSITYGSMPDNTQKAKALALSDLVQLQNAPISAGRLQHAKALLIGEVPIHEQSYSGVARQLLSYAQQDLPLDENLREAAAELSITPDMIRDAMRKWIRPGDMVEIVEGPAPTP